jgi:hypothetical protein
MMRAAAREVATAIREVYDAAAAREALRRAHAARAGGKAREDTLLIHAAILLCRPKAD